MDYTEFINKIDFKLLKPDMNFSVEIPADKEIANTTLPYRDKEFKTLLAPLKNIPKMSTFAISSIINKGIENMSPEHAFVNIGLWCGFTFFSGLINNGDKKCIGVDNFSQFGGPKDFFLENFNKFKTDNHFFYEMDYKEYFSKIHKESIGFYIYDGEHSYEEQYNGLKIAEPFFADGCYILVDDTNTSEAYDGTMDFISKSENSYKIIFDRKTSKNQHPTFWNGIIVLQKQ